MPRIALNLLPSMYPDDSDTAAEGAVVSGQWARTQRKRWQMKGGYESVILEDFDGVCRGIHVWTLDTGVVAVAIGTNEKLYVYVGGEYFNITPSGLATGLVDGTGVGGYGTGTYGSGTYGSFTPGDYRPRIWTFGNFGGDLIAAPLNGTIYRWTQNTGTPAAALSGAPAEVGTIFVDPNGLIVAVGSDPEGSGTFKPLLVRHSDQEAITDWSASASDQAGEYPFYIGSRLVRGVPTGNGFNGLWTDTHFILQRYTGDPLLVYSYQLAGKGGLIAPNAVGLIGGWFYWWGADGQFYRSAGGPPEPVPCTGQRTLNENLAFVQSDKIFCFVNAAFNEVGWLYPDFRDGNECSRYAIHNIADGGWYFGSLDRTAWFDAGPLPSPIATSAGGRLYYHERGQSADGSSLTSSLKAAPVDMGDGDTVYEVQRLILDMKDQVGGVDYYFHTRQEPNDTPTENGPYTAGTSTKTVEPLLSARQIALEFRTNSAPSFWRLGVPRVEAVDTGEEY